MTLYELIKDGFDRDCIIYDSDSCRLSKRLLCLMMHHAHKNKIEPNVFYVDQSQIFEIMTFHPLDVWPTPKNGTLTLWGIEFCFVDGLDYNDSSEEFTKFYEKMGGSLPTMKKSLVVLASKNQAILGCY